jgi:hypothetical protein
MRKDEAVGNKKKMQVCLPQHNYKLDNNTDPARNLDADPVPDPDQGGGLGQPKMCIPPAKS